MTWSTLTNCHICGTIASMRCVECGAPICDVTCRDACRKDHRAAGNPKPTSRSGPMWNKRVWST